MSTFFRFPLRVLSEFETPKERLENIVGFCVMDVGFKQLENSGTSPAKPAEKRRLAWENGCKILCVNSSGADADSRLQEEYTAVKMACGDHDQANVSIDTQWLWNCLCILRGNEQQATRPLSYREFSVICAILSKVGNKDFESCTWQEIQRRALGYTTDKEMQAKLSTRKDKAKPLSRQQIRTTLDILDYNRFFARYAVGNGQRSWLTYFSFKRNRNELAEQATAQFAKRRWRGLNRQTSAQRQHAAELWYKSKRAVLNDSPPQNHPVTSIKPPLQPPA